MKKTSILLAVLMLITALYIPSYAAVSETTGYQDEGEIPYFNTFDKEEDIEGREFSNRTAKDEWREVYVEDGSMIFRAETDGSAARVSEIRFNPAYTNTSDDRQPLVVEYKVSFDAGHKSSYFTQYGSDAYLYGIAVFPYLASNQIYFSKETAVKYTLENLKDWHTISIVYSATDNTKKLYFDGEYKGTSESTDSMANLWDDQGKTGTIRFYNYADKKDVNVGMITRMDYLKLYEVPEVFGAQILNSDAAELNGITIDFNSTVSNLNEETITVGGEIPEAIELIDEEKQIYKISLSENLSPDTEYTVAFNNVANMVGQSINEEIPFRTRNAKVEASYISLISGAAVEEGENIFEISYINETEDTITPVLVVNEFNAENRMIDSEEINLEFPELTEDITEAMVTLDEETVKAQLYILGADGLTNYSGAYTFDKSSDTVAEELIYNEAAAEPAYTYKVDDDTNEMNVEIIASEEGTANIIVTGADSSVLYKGQHNTTEKKAKFTFRLTDNGTYNLSYKMSGNSKWYTGNIKYFIAEYIDKRFEKFNETDDFSEIAEFITEFEDVLMLDTDKLNLIEDEEEKKLIYTSLLAQRNELETGKFADSDAVNLAFSTAYKLYDIYKGNANATDICEDIAEEEFFSFAKENFSEDLISYFNTTFKRKMYLTTEEFNKAFCDNVILSGIYKGENYTLTSKIIESFSEYIPLNLNNYGKLNNPAEADRALSGSNYSDLSALSDAFNSIVKRIYNSENKRPSSGGGGGGGGGAVNFSGGATGNKKPVEEITPVVPVEPEKNFLDLSGFEWAEKSINLLYEKGVINGISEKSFNPGGIVKREEFVKMIDCLYEAEDGSAEFIDVKSDGWYAPYVNKAVSAGIINGIDEKTFGTGLGVTRQDMAVMIYRLLKPEEAADAVLFADDSKIADYAKDAVYYLKSKGLISGTGNGNYEPERIMTRAEAAVLINNILNFIG